MERRGAEKTGGPRPARETQVYGCHGHRRSRHEICDLNRTTGETARGVSRTDLGWRVAFRGSRVEQAGAVAALNSSPRNLSLQCRRDGRTGRVDEWPARRSGEEGKQ